MTTRAGTSLIRDSSTVLLLDRQDPAAPKVLMGQRGKTAAFMPSKFVFPGGVLDHADAKARFDNPLSDKSARRLQQELLVGSTATPDSLAAAALRELAEETGLLCSRCTGTPIWPEYASEQLHPDPSGLLYFFRAITPPMLSRRYDTRFFLLDAQMLHGDPHDFSRASDELTNIHWVPLSQTRQLDLPFITEIVLAEVEQLLREIGDAPLTDPEGVPFFDNRSDDPRFIRLD